MWSQEKEIQEDETNYTVLVKIIVTLMDYCGIIYSPRNVCPGFKWYCSSLVLVCCTHRPVNHLAHMMDVLWMNGSYNLSGNLI
jgi:hypothetical protein